MPHAPVAEFTPAPVLPVARPGRRDTAVRLGAVGALTALLLAGCVAPKEQTTPEPAQQTPSAQPDAPDQGLATVDDFYGQELSWSDCGDGFECGTVAAPLDWDAPQDGAIDLAVKRRPAEGPASDRVGSLLINPGGPGGSGVDFLDWAWNGTFSEEVRAAYDLVGFDPRGVGASTAVDCGSDELVDEFLTEDVPLEDQADVEAAREQVEEFGEACLAATGPLLGEVDTVSAAHDLDLLRAVLGDDQLYFAGFSYGTFLGATYAGLYPENVGRLLLDGALDPSMSNDELSIGQAVGFEAALRSYVEDCQAGNACPLTGTPEEGMQQIADLVERVEDKPLDTAAGDLVNGTLAFYGIVVTLYDDASWPYLTLALTEAMTENTGDVLLQLANTYLDRTPDGEYASNSMIAFTAINCLDYPMEARDHDEMVAFAEELAEQAPTFGRDFAMAVGCETWPFQSTVERRPITAAGAAPILVVGTTGDPATPYEWSVELAEQLESGTLLTWDGEGHTAYGRANDCLNDTVDAYLVDGVVPESGTLC